MPKKIEFPAAGATYYMDKYGVYEYGCYERHSVLAGRVRRVFLGCYDTLREAQKAHPDAEFQTVGH